MCLFPLGGFQNLLVNPTDRARRIADYLRVAIYMHFALALCMFLGGRWFDGAFDLIAATIGYMSIRNHDGYSIQQLLCYCIFCGMDFFWAVIRVIMYATYVTSDTPTKAWQFYIYVGTLIAAPLIYVLCTYLSYQVYKELRAAVNETVNALENGMPYGGGGGAAAAGGGGGGGGGGGSASMWRHPEVHPSGAPVPVAATTGNTAAGGFKPFTGTGHRLGGT